ncbi:MAG: hypothetical protein WDW38_008110 [Sanguina aurantia]
MMDVDSRPLKTRPPVQVDSAAIEQRSTGWVIQLRALKVGIMHCIQNLTPRFRTRAAVIPATTSASSGAAEQLQRPHRPATAHTTSAASEPKTESAREGTCRSHPTLGATPACTPSSPSSPDPHTLDRSVSEAREGSHPCGDLALGSADGTHAPDPSHAPSRGPGLQSGSALPQRSVNPAVQQRPAVRQLACDAAFQQSTAEADSSDRFAPAGSTGPTHSFAALVQQGLADVESCLSLVRQLHAHHDRLQPALLQKVDDVAWLKKAQVMMRLVALYRLEQPDGVEYTSEEMETVIARDACLLRLEPGAVAVTIDTVLRERGLRITPELAVKVIQ